MNQLTLSQISLRNSHVSPSAALAAIRLNKIRIPSLSGIQNINIKTSETCNTTPRNNDESSTLEENRANKPRKFSLSIPDTWKVNVREVRKGILMKRKEKTHSLMIIDEKIALETPCKIQSCPSTKLETESQNQIDRTEENSNSSKHKKAKKVSFAADVKSEETTPNSSLSSKLAKKYRTMRHKRSLPLLNTQQDQEIEEPENKVIYSSPGDVCMAIRTECDKEIWPIMDPKGTPERRTTSLKLRLDDYSSRNEQETVVKSIRSVDQGYGFKLPLIGTNKRMQEASSLFKESRENPILASLNRKSGVLEILRDSRRDSEQVKQENRLLKVWGKDEGGLSASRLQPMNNNQESSLMYLIKSPANQSGFENKHRVTKEALSLFKGQRTQTTVDAC